ADEIGANDAVAGSRAAVDANAERQASLKGVDAINLPTAKHPIDGARPVAAPVFAATKREFIKGAEDEAIVLVDVGAAMLELEVLRILRRAIVKVAAGIIKGFGPGKRRQGLESIREPALILRLE